MRLKNKVALITGGSHGIGRAIALKFASEGARVAICGIEQQALAEVADLICQQGGEGIAHTFDVQVKAEVDEWIDLVIARWGHIDVLVNNAGIHSTIPFLDIAEAEWDRQMSVNLKGTFLVSQRVAQEMVKRKCGGSIIQMSSVNGLAAEIDQAHYNASKGGINLLMMSMALELAKANIRVNAVCPGFIETRLTQPLVDNPSAIASYLQTIPMERVGQPEDIANAALFMASDESSYMTGHCMVIDGGQFIKLS